MGKVENLHNFFSGVFKTILVSKSWRPELFGFFSLKYTNFNLPDMSRVLQWKTRFTVVKKRTWKTGQIFITFPVLCKEGSAAVEVGPQELPVTKHVNISRQPLSRQQRRNLKEEATVEIKYALGYMVESDECHGKKLWIKHYEDGSRKGVNGVRKAIN